MKKKMYARVVTLILAALMMLSMLAPMFSRVAFADTLLEVDSVSGNAETASGVPNSSVYTAGSYEIKVLSLAASDNLSVTRDGTTETKTATFSSDNTVLRYGGLRFTKDGGASWADGDIIELTIVSTSVDGQPRIIASSASTSRVRKGRQVTLDLTIVDTNFAFSDASELGSRVKDAFVLFEQGDFKRSGSGADSISSTTNANGQLQFAVQLKDIVYTGSGDTAKFTIGYRVDGKAYEYDMSIKVDGCIPYVDSDDDDDDDDEVDLDPLIPHIIVNQYDYGTTQVAAGQLLDLDLSFSNTSNQYDLDNIVMKITTPDGFAITSSSNTYYFDNLDVGESISQTISLQANPSAEAKSHAITIDFSFQYIANDVRKSGESSESISIPISQPDRFSVDEIQVPTSIYVGDEYNVSVNFVNKGKAEVYNVTAELRGNMQNNGERTFIGNVASGTENSADFYITPTEPGVLEGEIIISYEDSNMNVKEISKPFTIPVESYPIYDPDIDMPTIDPEPVEEPSPFSVQNVVLGIVAIGVAGATGYMTVLKIKAKRSEFDDEDL